MKIQNGVNPPLNELAHYGVKGMKWGERHADPTTAQIKDARAKVDSQRREINSLVDKANTTKGKEQDRIINQYQKKRKAFEQDEARVTAVHMTNGEKVAAAILAGPVGLLVIAGNKGQIKREAADVDDARKFYSKK